MWKLFRRRGRVSEVRAGARADSSTASPVNPSRASAGQLIQDSSFDLGPSSPYWKCPHTWMGTTKNVQLLFRDVVNTNEDPTWWFVDDVTVYTTP